MIRALLDGTKTQTRRVVKDTGLYAIDASIHGEEVAQRELARLATRSPYGQPGDQLIVREAWRASAHFDNDAPRTIPHGAEIWYEATSIAKQWRSTVGKLRPSMFMCRWMSRITLEIGSVRVERLQDISDADAAAEGVTAGRYAGLDRAHARTYSVLWESINGTGSWSQNPWVWVVEFKVVKP